MTTYKQITTSNDSFDILWLYYELNLIEALKNKDWLEMLVRNIRAIEKL